MSIASVSRAVAAAVAACAATLTLAQNAQNAQNDNGNGGNQVRSHHVLLISIDGMHAVDFKNCASAGTCPNLAALERPRSGLPARVGAQSGRSDRR